jgi:hypothetical protein
LGGDGGAMPGGGDRHAAGAAGMATERDQPAVRTDGAGGVCAELPGGLVPGAGLPKGAPLGIRPWFVRRDDQLVGLSFLLLRALRVLTLCAG